MKDNRLLHYRKNIAVDLGLQNEAELKLEMADKLTSFQAVERDMVHALWLASPDFVNHLVDLLWSNSGAQDYLNTKEICAPPGAFCKWPADSPLKVGFHMFIEIVLFYKRPQKILP